MTYDPYQIVRRFALAMEWASEPEIVYQRFVDVAVECLAADAAHLHLLDINEQSFQHLAFHDDLVDASFYSESLTKNIGRMADLVERHDLIIMDDYENPLDEDQVPEAAVKAGFKSSVSIPLLSSSGVLGILSLIYRRPLPWSDEDHGFLVQLGSLLGVFTQRLQMQKKELELQLLRERKQLGNEIHDNISQMVSALAIRTDIALECLGENDTEGTAEELEELGSQARKITKILREEMLSLRTPVEVVGDVHETLEAMLVRFQEQWNIATNLEKAYEEPPRLSQYSMLQLIRIVNESLQNILRHSRATEVRTTVSRRNGHVVIRISDNGQGFAVDGVAPERLGIRIMRERAESADGTLNVSSGPDGTTVLLELPVVRAV